MIPRYEYRVWAHDLDELCSRLAEQCEPVGVRASEETYLVQRMDVNVKIRAGVLDVKRLIGTEQGFQLWTPIIKGAFPLSPAMVHEVLVHLLGADLPPSGDEPCEMGRFLDLAKEAGVTVATVSKRRHGYLHEGCILEFTEVAVDGSGLHSVAVESEDLDAAVEMAALLNISALPNQSYPTAIRQTLGL